MNAELLLAHFNRISDVPDAVLRLRRFILDLAVRGMLVEHDPNQEPVAALLNRIRREKIKLIERGNARKQKPLLPLGADEIPFPIPMSWQWSQLAEIGFINPRNSAEDGDLSSFVQMSSISAEYGVAHMHEVRPWGDIKSGFTHFAEGDVALAKITPCFENGKSTVFRNLEGGIGAGTTELHVVRPVFVSADYVLIFLKSPYFIESGIPKMTGTAGQKRVSIEYFAYSPFPLPPEQEQHRIVTKVDELMALCDRLGAAQRERESRRDQLASSVHHHLNNGEDAEAQRSHARFFIGHLPRITARPDQVKQLRQTVLDLAVRGYLVPQNSDDDSIIATLRHIVPSFTDHDQLTPNDSGSIDRHPLPKGWAWIKGKWIADFVDPQPSHRTPSQSTEGVPYIGYADITERGTIDFLNARKVSCSVLEEHRQRYTLKDGDFVIGKIGTIGDPFLLPSPFNYTLSANIILVQPRAKLVLPKFLMLFLNSPIAKAAMVRLQTDSTHAVFGIKKARELPIPLPTINEQRRIVAKVDELMALCDQLEVRLTTAQTESSRLLESVLHNALNADTAEAISQVMA